MAVVIIVQQGRHQNPYNMAVGTIRSGPVAGWEGNPQAQALQP